jgi:hypothetical protein
MCAKYDKTFILLLKQLEKLSPTSTNIHYESLVEKYKNKDMTLFILCFTEFITNDDIKTCKRVKIIHWVCFNVHKNLENRYKKLLLLFKPFCGSKITNVNEIKQYDL